MFSIEWHQLLLQILDLLFAYSLSVMLICAKNQSENELQWLLWMRSRYNILMSSMGNCDGNVNKMWLHNTVHTDEFIVNQVRDQQTYRVIFMFSSSISSLYQQSLSFNFTLTRRHARTHTYTYFAVNWYDMNSLKVMERQTHHHNFHWIQKQREFLDNSKQKSNLRGWWCNRSCTYTHRYETVWQRRRKNFVSIAIKRIATEIILFQHHETANKFYFCARDIRFPVFHLLISF